MLFNRNWVLVPAAFVLAPALARAAQAPAPAGPETVIVDNGPLALRALLWRPAGPGPFPAVLFNHGLGRSREELRRLGPFEAQASVLGPVFARHGYLFRHGVGLSAGQGTSSVELLNTELAARGLDAQNALNIQLLEDSELRDALAGLAFLRARHDADSRRLAVVGHGFGSPLTLLIAEREPDLGAVVVFSGAGYTWDRTAKLRRRMLTAVDRATAPVFLVYASKDYSVPTGKALNRRLQKLGKPHRMQVYPKIGKRPEVEHDFLYLGVTRWEPDVFAFLDEYLRR